jgi:uncharacterized RDD family membrane protein YckC
MATNDYGSASGPRAGFWRRVGAGIIDGIVVSIIPGIVYAATTNRSLESLLSLVIGLAYTTYLEGGPTGQSLGKRVLGTRVVDAATGGPIGYGRGAVRYVVAIISAIPCMLGYLWMLWDGEKQTWHDKASNSYVVPVAAYPVA